MCESAECPWTYPYPSSQVKHFKTELRLYSNPIKEEAKIQNYFKNGIATPVETFEASEIEIKMTIEVQVDTKVVRFEGIDLAGSDSPSSLSNPPLLLPKDVPNEDNKTIVKVKPPPLQFNGITWSRVEIVILLLHVTTLRDFKVFHLWDGKR